MLKIYIRLLLAIFCRKIIINKPYILHEKGPLLIAANHPNSFLDAVVLDVLFAQPVWSLARGDTFKKNFFASILRSLKIMPVYRSSEGVENLSENYKTFDACLAIFAQNGLVTIYSEGLCENEWHLRPLKKGTARLVLKAWENGLPLKVLPTGINYSSFSLFGKNVFINFGNIITPVGFSLTEKDSDGAKHLRFNKELHTQLADLVFEIPLTDKQQQRERLSYPISTFKKIVLFLPALVGLLIHFLFFFPIQFFIKRKTSHTVHYDSILAGALLICYPFYLLLIALLTVWLSGIWWSVLLCLIAPFTAWAYVQLKRQTDKI